MDKDTCIEGWRVRQVVMVLEEVEQVSWLQDCLQLSCVQVQQLGWVGLCWRREWIAWQQA
jgi:hypothetical protein